MVDPDVLEQSIETRTVRLSRRADGIIVQSPKPGAYQTLEDARENLAAVATLAGGQKRPLMLDMRTPIEAGPGVRDLYVSDEGNRDVVVTAVLIKSGVGRALGNMMLALNPPHQPMRIFTSEEEAIAWLRKFARSAPKAR